MSQPENPITTVIRLLNKNLKITKEDGATANIQVTPEWQNQELLKNYDAQVTVGLTESRDNKVEISGRIRQRTTLIRVGVWTMDKQASADSGRLMREKIVEEINRVVKQNRSKPNETLYNFAGVGQTSETHKAYHAEAVTELPPEHADWTELTNAEYEKIWYSDDNRHSKTSNVNGEYALMLFRFKIESRKETIKQIVLTFEGYGTAPSGNGVTVKVWNHVAEEWQNAQNGTGETDETLVVTLASQVSDFVDEDGFVWLLARTANPSDGSTPAILYCDYVCCTVTVYGITYLDIVSFRDADRVDVKPILYHTEFTLKSWSFEDVGGVF